jgi:predicted metal-binding membrane protein
MASEGVSTGTVSGRSPRAWLRPGPIAAAVIAAALAAWAVTIEQMRGVGSGPGGDLGGFGAYLVMWVTMSAAMMLPTALPMVLTFARVSQKRAQRGQSHAPTWIFIAGYLLVWSAFGIVAYAGYRLIDALDAGLLAWDRGGPWVAGLAIAAAGAYQLTPLKRVCLRHCRTPLHFVLQSWRDGRDGALRMGIVHGAYCVGCCWALMLILFVLGVMSLFWMAVVTVVMFAEKVLPFGARLQPVVSVALIVLGLVVAAFPGAVPGLVEPGKPGPGHTHHVHGAVRTDRPAALCVLPVEQAVRTRRY